MPFLVNMSQLVLFIVVAAIAAFTFFPVASEYGAHASSKLEAVPTSVDTLGIKSKSGSNGRLKMKASVQAPSKVNGTKAEVMEGLRSENETQSQAPKDFYQHISGF